MDINNLINSFGFPITACCVMGIFIYKMWQKNNDTNERTLSALDKVTDTNNKLVLTNQSLIQNMDSKINVIENKVDEIAEKIK